MYLFWTRCFLMGYEPWQQRSRGFMPHSMLERACSCGGEHPTEANPVTAWLGLRTEEVWAMAATKQCVSWIRFCDDTPESEGQTLFKTPQAGLSLGWDASVKGGQQTLRPPGLPSVETTVTPQSDNKQWWNLFHSCLFLEKNLAVLVNSDLILYACRKQCEWKD